MLYRTLGKTNEKVSNLATKLPSWLIKTRKEKIWTSV
ncbi:hypothetical protein CLOBY_18660 [Clostridium saccharobutylicum]|nr:hypothetical protein CLOSC_17530 [Clostridium saccharobutylicum]OAV38451.1 hypothetical protein M945_4138 [Clostridium saccharobutylicum DSM 13864]AQR99951.1 hypothetical protein CSACC_17600 [Clostridium saccharobutylicum]AQS09735.1 hypothetical protein CLOBY_18660 [Clostridium saccharobutylicum]AQS13935.1 hypothetical protein CLOSACC_17600 [Clostridium saccharobutylicum]